MQSQLLTKPPPPHPPLTAQLQKKRVEKCWTEKSPYLKCLILIFTVKNCRKIKAMKDFVNRNCQLPFGATYHPHFILVFSFEKLYKVCAVTYTNKFDLAVHQMHVNC